MKRRIQFRIPRDWAGQTLVDFLARRFPYHPAEEWRRHADAGRVHVNAEASSPERILRQADLVEYLAADVPEPDTPLTAPVVFEDADLLIVDKPAGLPTHPGGRYFNHTLWAVLKQEGRIEAPAFVNRLDRETSGLVVVAKTVVAARKCRDQFATRTVEKRYLAIVEGEFPVQLGASGFLFRDTSSTIKRQMFTPAQDPQAAPPAPDAQWAATDFRRVRVCGELSLVEAIPETGRTHQLRAMLNALGYPLVGDKLYGPDPSIFTRFCNDVLTSDDLRLLRMDRQALHAASLRFRHPRTGLEMRVEAKLPDDMARMVV